jgi:hypothetical protein
MAKVKEYGHLAAAIGSNAPEMEEKEYKPRLNVQAHISTGPEYDDSKYRKEEVKRLRKEIKQGEDHITNWNPEEISKQAMKSFKADLARQKARLMECEAMLEDEGEDAKGEAGAKEKGSVVGGPYQIRQKGDEFQVVNMETGAVKGTHASKKKALRQFRALEMIAHDEK